MSSLSLSRSLGSLAVLALVSVALSHAAQAQTPIVDFTGTASTFTSAGNAGTTAGYSFTANTAQTLTGLGFYDVGADGIANSHTVGLFTSTGTLLQSLLITNANSTAVASSSSQGNYRRVNFASAVSLPAGQYVLGATYVNNDADLIAGFNTSAATTASGITFGGARETQGSGSTLVFPTNNLGGSGYYGPTAFIGGAAAPEPGSVALLALSGLPAVGMIARRRGQKYLTERKAA